MTDTMLTGPTEPFLRLGVALAIGLLIGIERGWRDRAAGEGRRVAGLRTFGLLGLLGGTLALTAEALGAVILGLGFVAVSLALIVGYLVRLRGAEDLSMTSLIAGLAAFALAALAGLGAVTVAAAGAVLVTLLLGLKPQLHGWLATLEPRELSAGLQLLLISVVLLPLLPDRGFGPWAALNPFEIWWMVVLIASISFAGYVASKLGGARRGAVLTGLFAGLASSTALTLHFARLSRQDPPSAPLLGIGILIACSLMFPRMLLIVALIHPELMVRLWPALLGMAAVVLIAAALRWRALAHLEVAPAPLRNPLELRAAVAFGLLLASVMLIGSALQALLGDLGILVLAVVSGIADVDAISLSLARLSQGTLGLEVASLGIVIAAAVNTLVKGGLAAAIGGMPVAREVTLPLTLSALTGLALAWWMFTALA